MNKLLDPGAIGSTDATLKVTVTPDPRTNSLMIRASSGARLAAAKQLAQKLDAPTSQPGNMHVVALRNADATRLAKTLRGMLGKGGDSGQYVGLRIEREFVQPERQRTRRFVDSTGTSGTPPLPSGGLAGSSMSSRQQSAMSGGSSGNRRTASFSAQQGQESGDDQRRRHDPGRRRDELADHHGGRAGVPQSARGDRPARRAPRAGVHRGADRRTELERRAAISAFSGRARTCCSNSGNNACTADELRQRQHEHRRSDGLPGTRSRRIRRRLAAAAGAARSKA